MYVLTTKDMWNAYAKTPAHMLNLLHLPCKYCRNAEHIKHACPQMTVHLTLETKNHSPHCICLLLQSPAAENAIS